MNERFLFRGKRIDNLRKSWEIGHYVSVPRHMIVLPETMLSGNWHYFDVDPATIGQCTGLRDTNGVLIFDGDIIKLDNGKIGGVTWRLYEFRIVYMESEDDTFSCFEYDYLCDGDVGAEIIGNIYDNPELLRGVEQ